MALVYVDQESCPGIQRQRRGKGFAYRAPDGHWLSRNDPFDRAHLARIRSLAIPPAYEKVWICPHPDGHIQATARDARGRKQYRYHPDWERLREHDKFVRMQQFGHALGRIRAQVQRDLREPTPSAGPTREQVLATLVRLLDTTHMRVGNEAYARVNKAYGLTTLRNRHAKVEGQRVSLRFRGKSGVWHDVALQDPRVARLVSRCQCLPGQALFQYVGENQVPHNLGSTEVNEYIRRISGGDFTAKDFRTWHATVHAWSLLASHSQADSEVMNESAGARAQRINRVLDEVAAQLGNTRAVCRSSYVHPLVLQWAQTGSWPQDSATDCLSRDADREGLDSCELALLCSLDRVSSSCVAQEYLDTPIAGASVGRVVAGDRFR